MIEIKKNRQKLRQLMATHNVRGKEVADLTGRAVATVYVWMCEGGADIQDETLCYLEWKLQQEDKGVAQCL